MSYEFKQLWRPFVIGIVGGVVASVCRFTGGDWQYWAIVSACIFAYFIGVYRERP